MDPLFKTTSLSPGAVAAQSQDSSDEASDERTSFIRSAKAQRKYGSTTSSKMNDTSPMQYRKASLQPTTYIHHQVQPGDTLIGIALRYQTTMEYIKRINKMWTSDTLFLHDSLLVPSPEQQQNSFTKLMMEDEVNGTSVATLEASCSEILSHSLNVITLGSKTSLGRTNSSNSTESPATDTSIHDYLGSIDSQIEEAKSRAQALQKTSDILKDHPELSSSPTGSQQQASSRLRLIVGTGLKKSKARFGRKDSSRDEIFEL
nr:EOG090X0DPX [Eurycercus lamellatus]